ncbi:MAG: DUF4112 domain-containing protein [Prevotella bivia]|jgi:hypothetical protein|uniref:DUF4112 domain-containing protein n=1 Tax=Prevotella bivia DSM 20514 TaxID=868129 RepID=I4ZAZ2_9BACT|nr:DUF4112 domain-containing protein [Prevotella bivia]EFB92944.1 hypothetical protein HMPREF0648_1522 [Prevotella bivia JCVIHMP010]EIM33384.1 hypothetical protein PrebiDRAFT_1695 [Prevotella bivia DSM 20514]KGF21185.1 hypothetical protein HMPREF1651_07865 [Prevotella bivia DNF00188]KGF39111.1 hypothetical protein HMPREF2136_00245 [Prevotella bivia DNF00650]KXU58726.1 hypothetical protein HMPREF3218_0200815 [Prevotella bivia]
MNEEKRRAAQQRISESTSYRNMERIQKVMDQYYLDGIIGLLPFGIGDVIASFCALTYVWFAMRKVKSIPLTLAIINNSLRDILLGLIPFYIGNIIDFFHKANKQNMALVQGFVEGDKATIHTVNKKAIQSGLFIILSIALIALLLSILASLTLYLFHFLQGIFS